MEIELEKLLRSIQLYYGIKNTQIASLRDMIKEYSEIILTDFIDEIREYVHESNTNIALDDRDNSEFVNIFMRGGTELLNSNIDIISVTDLIEEFCSFYNIPFEKLKQPNRCERGVNDLRFVLMTLIRNNNSCTLRVIGDMFNRDHTTVMNAIKKTREVAEITAIYDKFIKSKN